jgi:hypothetical protein
VSEAASRDLECKNGSRLIITMFCALFKECYQLRRFNVLVDGRDWKTGFRTAWLWPDMTFLKTEKEHCLNFLWEISLGFRIEWKTEK